MITFYHTPRSHSAIVHWMIEEVGAPYRMYTVDLQKGAQKSTEFLAVNPMGKVPAIVHEDVVVTEAAAICTYLTDTFPDAGLAIPAGNSSRGAYLNGCSLGQAASNPRCSITCSNASPSRRFRRALGISRPLSP